jgi:preprotein translocase SecE subunit
MAELHRVDWPSWNHVRKSATSVVVVSAFVGLFLFCADHVISWGMKYILPHH